MSETTTTAPTTEVSTPVEGVPADKFAALNVDSLVGKLKDVGIAWASIGIESGKVALESTSRALAETAKSLEEIAEKIKQS